MDYYYINEIVEMSSLRENLNKQSLSSQFKLSVFDQTENET